MAKILNGCPRSISSSCATVDWPAIWTWPDSVDCVSVVEESNVVTSSLVIFRPYFDPAMTGPAITGRYDGCGELERPIFGFGLTFAAPPPELLAASSSSSPHAASSADNPPSVISPPAPMPLRCRNSRRLTSAMRSPLLPGRPQ